MNNNSGINTILIVVVLVLIVGFGVWYFKGGMMNSEPTNTEDAGFDVDLNVDGEGE